MVGLSELEHRPERLSASPLLLQSLGRTPVDPPTSGPLGDTPRRSYTGKGTSWCQESSYPPQEGFPLSPPSLSLGHPLPLPALCPAWGHHFPCDSTLLHC